MPFFACLNQLSRRIRNALSTRVLAVALVSACGLTAAFAYASSSDFPITPGVTIVIAVSNKPLPEKERANEHVAQGDYEVIVRLTAIDSTGLSESAFIDGVDGSGKQIQVTIPRRVLLEDLASSRMQVLGFMSSDAEVLDGTTSLGPSLTFTRELLTKGSAAYSFSNFSGQPSVSGTLTLGPAKKPFPVLINGQRVMLDAIVATGQMSAGSTSRPFEQYILDNPKHPISLRIAYGPRGGAFSVRSGLSRAKSCASTFRSRSRLHWSMRSRRTVARRSRESTSTSIRRH